MVVSPGPAVSWPEASLVSRRAAVSVNRIRPVTPYAEPNGAYTRLDASDDPQFDDQ